MDLEKYEHTIECQRARLGAVEAELAAAREGASIIPLEARIQVSVVGGGCVCRVCVF